MSHSIPAHVSALRAAMVSERLFGQPIECSVSNGEIEIYPRPRQLSSEEIAFFVEELNKLEPIIYDGKPCENHYQADQITNQKISDFVAPDKPIDLQAVERERLLGECVAILIAERLGAPQTEENTALLARNLQTYMGVMAIKEQGAVFKQEKGL